MSVLIASHDKITIQHIMDVLHELHVDAVVCQNGLDVLRGILDYELDAAIIDVDLPGLPSIRVAELIRGVDGNADLPVFLFGACDISGSTTDSAIDLDSLYWLRKPFSSKSLKAKLSVHLEVKQLQKQQQALIHRVTITSESLAKRALQLNTLAQVNQHITSILDLQLLLPTVTSLVCNTFGYYYVGIWLVTGDGKHIVLQAGHNQNGTQPFPPGFVIEISQPRSILAHVCRTKQAWLANDVEEDPYYWDISELPETSSEITLPLTVGSHFMGVIDIHSSKINGFDSVDTILCQALADGTATAIRNAQLYEGLERRVRDRTEELERAVYQLETLDREKTNFIQVVSHELLTPLTFILGFSQVMQDSDHDSDPETCKQQAKAIYNGAQRMHHIIQNMLDVVQLDFENIHLDTQLVVLHNIIAQVMSDFDDAILERNLVIEFDLNQLPRIEGDPQNLRKMFSQIISNAIKYTPDGGHISVRGNLINDPVPTIEVVVQDNGIGIDPKALELIFSKFYRIGDVAHHSSSKTRFKGGGAGLGLAIAQGIAKAHHGHIHAISTGLDEKALPGSSFHIRLPLKQPRE